MTVAAAHHGITVGTDEGPWALSNPASPQVEYRKPA